MKKAMFNLFLFFPLIILSESSYAFDYQVIFSNGIDSGGDVIWETKNLNGVKQTMSGADGVYFMGGLGMTLDSKKVDIQLLMGWKHTAVTGLGISDVRWTRWPIEFLTFYRYKRFRLGLGATYHLNSKRSGNDETKDETGTTIIINAESNFDNSIGFISELGFVLNENIVLGSRISRITYKNATETFTATGLGMNLKFLF